MAKGYWVVTVEVTDLEAYKVYRAFVEPFLAERGGRFIVRGGQRSVVEGQVASRVVVVEFPSYEAATAAYHSAEYAEGKKLRLDIAVANFAIVEGVAE
jgi:uncharacterized protein (DUF1330 family)